jgi:hypothetical protein
VYRWMTTMAPRSADRREHREAPAKAPKAVDTGRSGLGQDALLIPLR